ncbi:MAG: hypothetical protein U1F52_19700 [Burkholderiales bacterium]
MPAVMRAPWRSGRVACVVAAAMLGGCDAPYPEAWAPVSRAALADFSGECPDLTGTYRIPSSAAEEGEVSLAHTFVGQIPAWQSGERRWETLTFAGDADHSLTLTLTRSPATMEAYRRTIEQRGGEAARQYRLLFSPAGRHAEANASLSDAAYEEHLKRQFLWPVERVTLRKGRDYACFQGWVRSRRIAEPGRGERRDPRAPAVNGEVLMGRDTAGYLVGQAVFRKPITYAPGCDACPRFDLGNWNVSRWQHWAPSAPAWVGEVPRPWAASAVPEEAVAPEAAAGTDRRDVSVSIASRLQPLLPDGVLLGKVVAEGVRYRLTVFSDDANAVQRLIRNVSASEAFEPPQVLSMARNASRLQETVLLLAARAPR